MELPDLTNLTRDELRALYIKYKLKNYTNSNKADLIIRLTEYSLTEEFKNLSIVEEVADEDLDLTTLKRSELVELCKKYKLTKYHSLNLNDLLVILYKYLKIEPPIKLTEPKIIKSNVIKPKVEIPKISDSRILVSPEDAWILTKYKWHIDKKEYARSTIMGFKWSLHRYIYIEILKYELNKLNQVEHINRIKYDNRRENLHIVTPKQRLNNTNIEISIYDGVSKNNDKFESKYQDSIYNLYASYAEEIYAGWQYNIWIDTYNLHIDKNDITEIPLGFVEYTMPDSLETLPRNIYKIENKFMVQYKGKNIDTYISLNEARNSLYQLYKEKSDIKFQEIKNNPIIRNEDGYAIITITNKKNKISLIIVDDEDYYILLNLGHITIYDGYANIHINNKHKKLHRFLLKYNGLDVVDHINCNSLDNRKSNLRIVTSLQNCQNKGSGINSSSNYVGVSKLANAEKWVAYITINSIRYNIGQYNTELEAAQARDKRAIKANANGAMFKLNLPA